MLLKEMGSEERMLAKRMDQIKASATLAVSAKAKEMRAQGMDVVDFSVGEPDFPTPEAIKAAGIQAIRDDFTRYTASNGIPELRQAICAKLLRDNGLEYDPAEIIVSTGAKQSLYNAAIALFERGDEVLVPTPCWVSYTPQVALAGASSILIPTTEETGFRITPKQLEDAITPKTKAIILNSPSNPTGVGYTREDLAAIARVLEKTGIFVIADEIYEKLVYDGFSFTSFPSLAPSWKERCLIINGVSKTYAMTGWRIGFAAGPRDIIRAMGTVQSHSTSNANAIAQKAALEAISGPQEEIEKMRQAFEQRRDLMLARMEKLPGVRCVKPQGAFYVFPNWSAYVGRRAGDRVIESCVDLATYFLEEAQVALVPGVGFEAPGYLRFSYATSRQRIEEGMQRIAEAAARLE
jgi:aspartate aminotransferase